MEKHMQFIYQTERLFLKILSSEDYKAVTTFYRENRKFLEPFEPHRPENFYSESFQRSNLKCEYQAFMRMNYFRYWLFKQSKPEIPLGSICFSNFLRGAFQKCMVGYKLAQTACHQGYMTEALSSLLPLIKNELKLHRIEAYVQPDNLSSIQLLNRTGFIEEGYLQKYAEINGYWTDHLIFSYFG